MANFYSQGNTNFSGAAGYGSQSAANNGNLGGNSFQQFQQQPQQNTGLQQRQSFGQSSQSQPQQQQHFQQQEQTAKPFWTPNVQQAATQAAAGFMAQAATGNLTSEKVLTKGMDEIQKAFGGGIPGMNYVMIKLRSYFAVDNHYVKRKMIKVLFPFLNRHWRRDQVEGPEMVNYALPHSDENAPDLYLPSMSLMTYCLLSAFLYGTAGQFNPEVIADVITKCFITQVMEVITIWGCLYAMQAHIAVLDLFSYTGYKYLGLTISMLCGIVFKHLELGTASFYGAFAWTASAAAWFMLKTMANNIPVETASTGPKRDIMVLAFAASQVATMWFVSQTKYL